VVDGGGLENRWTGNGPGGSNPSPSAISPPGRLRPMTLLRARPSRYASSTKFQYVPSAKGKPHESVGMDAEQHITFSWQETVIGRLQQTRLRR
jgi:hypothetical protein